MTKRSCEKPVSDWCCCRANWLCLGVLLAVPLGIIVVDNDADLEQVRRHINQLQEVGQEMPSLEVIIIFFFFYNRTQHKVLGMQLHSSQKTGASWIVSVFCWCSRGRRGRGKGQLRQRLSSLSYTLFAATTAERFFRIDRGQEHLHYVTDISSEDLYILDPDIHVSFMQQAFNGSVCSVNHSSCYSLSAKSDSSLPPVINGHKPLQRLSNTRSSSQLVPPTTVIVQDLSVDDPSAEGNGQVKMTFTMPVTPPKSPG